MGDLPEEHLIEPEDRAQDQARDGTHQVDLSNQRAYSQREKSLEKALWRGLASFSYSDMPSIIDRE